VVHQRPGHGLRRSAVHLPVLRVSRAARVQTVPQEPGVCRDAGERGGAGAVCGAYLHIVGHLWGEEGRQTVDASPRYEPPVMVVWHVLHVRMVLPVCLRVLLSGWQGQVRGPQVQIRPRGRHLLLGGIHFEK